jgi:hypothetical protein
MIVRQAWRTLHGTQVLRYTVVIWHHASLACALTPHVDWPMYLIARQGQAVEFFCFIEGSRHDVG